MVTADGKFRDMGFSYDANGRMVKATRASTPDAHTVYDALGNRVAAEVDGVWRFSIYDAFGKLVAEYGQADEGAGGVSWIQQDWQGSVRTITNELRAHYEPDRPHRVRGGRLEICKIKPLGALERLTSTHPGGIWKLKLDAESARIHIFADEAYRNPLARSVQDKIDDCKGKPGTPKSLPSVEEVLKRVRNLKT